MFLSLPPACGSTGVGGSRRKKVSPGLQGSEHSARRCDELELECSIVDLKARTAAPNDQLLAGFQPVNDVIENYLVLPTHGIGQRWFPSPTPITRSEQGRLCRYAIKNVSMFSPEISSRVVFALMLKSTFVSSPTFRTR